jgi:RimJ/RimL family protein N-acetyltransferase
VSGDPAAKPLELETNRLVIRPFAPDDVAAVHAYLSDPQVRLFVPEWPETLDGTEAFVRKNFDDPRQHAIVRRADDLLVGHVGFWLWFEPRTFEIGWAIAPAHQSRGYATEAARAVLAHGFKTLGLHRIVATCDPRNLASVRVMEKLGMRREAHFRLAASSDGGATWSDEYFYAILDEEWFARAPRAVTE